MIEINFAKTEVCNSSKIPVIHALDLNNKDDFSTNYFVSKSDSKTKNMYVQNKSLKLIQSTTITMSCEDIFIELKITIHIDIISH